MVKVFWSWQSDRPGKTNRHFIRDCLQDAIDALKERESILEPTERESVAALHLDHDRKGVPGSPDLARTIFDKILSSSVFVADVTPVSTLRKTEEGGRRISKKNMNPNVAIELGYALHALGDRSVLMVMNSAYGSRKDLPFDLAHKAGPILYSLEEDADKASIQAQRSYLTGMLTSAIRPYLSGVEVAAAQQAFQEQAPNSDSGLFFAFGESLGSVGEFESGDEIPVFAHVDRHFYLRLIPTVSIERTLRKPELLQLVQNAMPGPFWRSAGGGFVRPNRYGVISFDLQNHAAGIISSLSQFFDTGEIWGVSTEWFKQRNDRVYIPTGALDTSLKRTLNSYVRFLKDFAQVAPPYEVEFGAFGLGGTSLVVADDFHGQTYWELHDPKLRFRYTLSDTSPAGQERLTEELLDRLFDSTGFARPKKAT